MNVNVYVLTNEGWMDRDDVLTPELTKVKRNALAEPTEANEELSRELKAELPMVKERKGYYFIQAI